MIPIKLLEDYLIDQEDGLKKLLTWFLNLVMQLEAMQQADAEPYQRVDSRKAHRNGYKARSLRPERENSNSRSPSSAKCPLRPKFLIDIHELRRH
jgi:transposase-like protein